MVYLGKVLATITMVYQDMNKLEAIKADFELRGEAIAEWAQREGFEPRNVYAILSGRNRGLRGEAHKIAVRLGLKADINKGKEEK